MVLIIHQAPLNMAVSPGARHRGDTDTENLRLLLSCPRKLEVPPDHVDLFLSVAGTDKTRGRSAAAAAKAAAKAAKKAAKQAKDAAKAEKKKGAKAAPKKRTRTQKEKAAQAKRQKEQRASRKFN
jgi:hypothetical protein